MIGLLITALYTRAGGNNSGFSTLHMGKYDPEWTKATRQILSFVFFLIFTGTSYADTVLFIDGTKLTGEIVFQNKDKIYFSSDNRRIQIFPKSKVRKITFLSASRSGKSKDSINSANNVGPDQQVRQRKQKLREMAVKAARRRELKRRYRERRTNLRKNEVTWDAMHRDYWRPEDEESAGEDLIPAVFSNDGITGGILLRNMIFPGWGHFYAGHKKSGLRSAGLFSIASAGAVYSFNQYRVSQNIYSKNSTRIFQMSFAAALNWNRSADLLKLYVLQSLDNKSYNTYYKRSQTFDTSIGVVSAVYLGVLLHSFFLSSQGNRAFTQGEHAMLEINIDTESDTTSNHRQEGVLIATGIRLRF